MTDLEKMEQEKSVLRWGGLAGMLGGFFFILAMVVVGVFIPPDPAELVELVARFPDIHAVRVVENGVYLVALLLEIPLFLAIYRALRKTNLASALFGSALGILGLTAMAISATPHVSHSPLSDLYLAPGITPADQATLAIVWKATWGVFDAPLYVGFFVIPIGLIILGMGMFGSSSFGKGIGGTIVVLGALGLVAAILQMVDPASMVGAGSYFVCLISYFVMGSKLHSLSKAS